MAVDNSTSIQIQVTARDDTTQVLKGIESSVIRFVGAVTATLAAIRVVAFPIAESKEFEKELLNVGKTTEYTAGQLSDLGDELKAISQRLNISEIDLAKVAAAGGQLGIGGEEGVKGLVAFTEAAARFSSVLDVTVDAAANGIGKLSNIFGIAISDAERISSLLNEVSNRSTASGEDLLDIMQRIGTAQGTLNIQQAAALAATGRDLGLTLETVGTSFNKIFLDLNTKSREVATLVGLPVEKFSEILQSDGVRALQLYLNALKELPATQRSALSEQITGGGRIAALVTSLINDASNGYELLGRNLAAARDGFEGGTSAMQEQERVLSGLDAQIEILLNTFRALADTLGRSALPYLKDLVKSLQDLLKSEDTVEFLKSFAERIGGAVVAIVDFTKAIADNRVAFTILAGAIELFLSYKIATAVISGGAAFFRYAQQVAAAGNALVGLATGNRTVIQQIAAQAAAVSQAGSTQLTLAAKTGVQLNTLYTGMFTLQDQLKEGIENQTTAEKAILEARQKRDALVKAENLEQQRLNALIRQGGSAAAANALAQGRSQAQARQAAQASVAANQNLLLLSRQREASIRAEARAEIVKQQEIVRTSRAQAAAAQSALANTSRFGLVLGGVQSAMSGLFAAGTRLFGLFVSGLGIAGVAIALLDVLGLLEPLITGFRNFFGISTEAAAAAQDAARKREAQFEAEIKNTTELAERYDRLIQTWREQPVSGESALEKRIDELFTKIDIVQGKIRSIFITDATAQSNLINIQRDAQSVSAALDEASAKLLELQRQQADAADSTVRDLVSATFPTLSKELLIDYNKEIENQQRLVDSLSIRQNELAQAQLVYQNLQKTNASSLVEAQTLEIDTIQRIAAAYSVDGDNLIRLTQIKLQAYARQAEAKKVINDLEQAGRQRGADGLETEAYVIAAGNLNKLSAEAKLAEVALSQAEEQAGIAAIRFRDLVLPQSLQSSLDAVNQRVSVLNTITGQNIEKTKEQARVATDAIQQADEEIRKAEARRAADILEAERSFILSIGAKKETLGLFYTEEDQREDEARLQQSIDKINERAAAETAAATLRRTQAQQSLTAYQREIAVTAQLAQGRQTLNRISDQQEATQRRRLIQLAGEAAALERFRKAQAEVVRQSRITADGLASSYESAKTDLENSIGSALGNAVALQERLIQRAQVLQRSRDAYNADKSDARRVAEQERIYNLTKSRLEAEGATAEEMDRILGQLRLENTRADERARAERAAVDLKKDINDQTALLASNQEQVNKALSEALELEKQSKAAKEGGNEELAGKLAEQSAKAADRASQAYERLTSNLEKLRQLSDTQTTDGSGIFKYIISDTQVQDIEKKFEALGRSIQETKVKVLETAKDMSEQAATQQSTALEKVDDRIRSISSELVELSRSTPGLAENLQVIGAAMEKVANSSGALDANLQTISNASFANIQQLDAVARNEKAMQNIAASFERVSNSLADNKLIDLSKADFTSGLANALKIDPAVIEKNIRDAAAKIAANPVQGEIQFPNAGNVLQQQLDARTFTANVRLNTSGAVPVAEAQQNAEGGYIQGPGTGVSDSILSWLSHGEFVVDALTTRMFGPGFFSSLQRMARGGVSGLSGMLAGRYGLPAFAGGGFVGVRSPEGDSRAGGGAMLQPILFNIGGESFTTYTDPVSGARMDKVARRESLKRGSRAGVNR